jgi:2-methylisocitrate lyase-like PEP mutase family enzyme
VPFDDASRERFAAFRRLHHADRPLFLPNVWDYASAAALTSDGYPAVGTTSLGVAAAAGKPDAASSTLDETVTLARALNRLPTLLTVDIEGGFSDDPREVAALVAELAALGVVGVNLEDGRTDGTLSDPALHSAKIAAIKQRVPGLFVNARTDTFWLADETERSRLDDTIRRAAVYLAAGADGIFVPGAADADTITALVADIDAPLNVLHLPGRHTLGQLAALGVARVSTGSLLFRVALGAAIRAADAIRRGDSNDGSTPPSYADVQKLIEPTG